MNYKLHYEKLISRAQNRSILKSEYKEVHHIIPKCMNGTDDKENLVALFPEEHLIAHLLLVKIYPNHHGLVKAATCMTTLISPNTIKRISNKKYSWLKKKHAAILSIEFSGCKNPKAKIINIYNSEGEVMFQCNGTFKQVCKEYNLPRHAFERSYKDNTKLLTTTNSRSAIKTEYLKYKNWYAKIINDKTDINYFNTINKLDQNGKNNPQTKKINIFDNNNVLRYTSVDGFSNFCKSNNLPLEAFRRSYKNNTRLYLNNRALSKAKLYGYEKYQGWYAVALIQTYTE